VVEATFDPRPITAEIAREWGRLPAAVRTRGGQPRRRAIDLVIAATATVYGVWLFAYSTDDFRVIDGLADVRDPSKA
jgi:predicted nucleic acid-binding protein